jgi:DNA-binding Xre family transcriptional regulator
MASGVRVNIALLKGTISGHGREIAEQLGIHSHSLYRKLRRENPTISLHDLNKICEILSRDAMDFLETFPLESKGA